MKVYKYFVILLILILSARVLLALDIEVAASFEIPYKITEVNTPIKVPIKILDGSPPYNYIVYPDINKTNSDTGVLNNDEIDTLYISKGYYSRPGIYIARVIIQDANDNIISREIKIIYYQPYLPDPIVGIHGFMGHPEDYYNESYKYIFNFLRGDWNDSEGVFEGGYNLVCVANKIKSDTERISESYKELFNKNLWGDFKEGFLVGYGLDKERANNIYDTIVKEEKDNFDYKANNLQWLPLAQKMWRYTFLRRYGGLPEDFGLNPNPKKIIVLTQINTDKDRKILFDKKAEMRRIKL